MITEELTPATVKDISKAEKRIEWMISFLICRFKFVHQILGMMTKHPDNNIGTMGVLVTESGKFELRYNPVFTNNLTDNELTYVLCHEVLHLALHHCTSRKLEEGYLWNMATDLAVNELIPNDPSHSCVRPVTKDGKAGGLFVSSLEKEPMFKDIQTMQTAEWYYDFLRKRMPQITIEIDGVSEEGQGGDGDEQGQGGGGDKKKGQKITIKIKTFDAHDGWREHEVADEKVRAKIKEVARMDSWGTVSASAKELIMAAQTKRINWKNKIRTWFGNMAWKDKTVTRKRPNRRTGFIHPGSKREFVDRWLVAADTSGSIDADLLAQWIGVMNQLSEMLPVDFMQFDCDKTEDPHPYNRRHKSLEFKGRGGTSFQPVIDIANKARYRGLMILTDGCAPAPTKPDCSKVLWVLPEGQNPPVDWGDKVYLTRHS